MTGNSHQTETVHPAHTTAFPDLGGLQDPALETLLGVITDTLRVIMNKVDQQWQLTNEELELPLLILLRSKVRHDQDLQLDKGFEKLVGSVIAQSPPHQALSQNTKVDLLRRATARLNAYTGRRLYTVPRTGPFYAPLEFVRDPGAVFSPARLAETAHCHNRGRGPAHLGLRGLRRIMRGTAGSHVARWRWRRAYRLR